MIKINFSTTVTIYKSFELCSQLCLIPIEDYTRVGSLRLMIENSLRDKSVSTFIDVELNISDANFLYNMIGKLRSHEKIEPKSKPILRETHRYLNHRIHRAMNQQSGRAQKKKL